MHYQPVHHPGVGQVTPITTCPHCSKLVNGTCVICEEHDQHPSCHYCVGGHYVPPAPRWYETDTARSIALTVATAAVIAVISPLVINKIEAWSTRIAGG